MKGYTIEEILDMDVESYFTMTLGEHEPRRYMTWLRDASQDILKGSRPADFEKNHFEPVKVGDLIKFPVRRIRSYRFIGHKTIATMNRGLSKFGLSLGMSLDKINALCCTQPHKDNTNDIFDTFADCVKNTFRKVSENEIAICIDKELIPGFECSIHFKLKPQ